MIDPLETVVVLLQSNAGMAAVIAGRVAARHRFGQSNEIDAWPTPAKAIQVGYDPGGRPQLSIAVQGVRLDARLYGEDAAECGQVYDALITLCREHGERQVVPTSKGNAFLYWLEPDSLPQTQLDTDLSPPIDYIQLFLTASVAETPV